MQTINPVRTSPTSRRVMRLRLDARDLLDMMVQRRFPYITRPVNVPADARAVGCYYEPFTLPECIWICIESESFDEVPEGEKVPEFICTVETRLMQDSVMQDSVMQDFLREGE